MTNNNWRKRMNKSKSIGEISRQCFSYAFQNNISAFHQFHLVLAVE